VALEKSVLEVHEHLSLLHLELHQLLNVILSLLLTSIGQSPHIFLIHFACLLSSSFMRFGFSVVQLLGG
jgi:hypothetical protein